MPPKKDAAKKVQIDIEDYRLNDVEKEFYKIQFNEIQKKTARYKDRIQELKSEIEKFTKKKNDLNDKFKDDYKFAQKACDEKEMHEKKLKKEIADLLNESKSEAENHNDNMDRLHDEFIRACRAIKTRTSVYAKRLNNLDEYKRQEKMLEQKLADTKIEIRVMGENYETRMKNIEWKKYKTKKDVQKGFIARCADFAETLEEDPAVVASFIDTNDVLNMLKTSKELSADVTKKILAMKKANIRTATMEKTNDQKMEQCYEVYAEKKRALEDLQMELDKESAQVADLRRELWEADRERRRYGGLFERRSRDAAVRTAAERDAQTVLTELQKIRSTDKALDLHILRMEDALLRIYEEAAAHAEHIKTDEVNGVENMKQFLEKMSELKPLTVPQEFTVDHLDELVLLTDKINVESRKKSSVKKTDKKRYIIGRQ